jgi:PAS domain S-box-containing protein
VKQKSPAKTYVLSLRGAVAFALVATALGASAAAPKRVLLIHSFGNALPQSRAVTLAFETQLAEKMGGQIDLDQVSLDMARYADGDSQEAMVDYLQKRQAKWLPDIVVTMAAPAAIFVATYRDRLFPEIPVVYASLDRRLLPQGALEKNAIYIGQEFNIPGWIEDMVHIAPATKNIEVVVGATPLERKWQEAFQKAAEPFAGRIKFTYYNDLPFAQVVERVAKLPPDSYIFLLVFLRDASGVTRTTEEALQRLHAVANAPINSIFSHQLGQGIVGGRLYQSDRIGKETADTAIRILNGESAANFAPVQIDPLPPRYDWRELRRWKIDEKILPPRSTVLYRTPGLWEEHRILIIGSVSIGVVEALLIAGLVINQIRRRRAERSLTESEQRFQNAADAAPVLMWMAGPDKRAIFFNKAWLNFTGRTMEQELGDGWADVVHEDDLENTVRDYHTAFNAREPFAIQNRLRRHDGEFRWVTATGTPRFDEQGKFLGYIGASIDITDVLKNEEALHESEERIALAAEAAHLGVWELNLATNETWVSDKARDLFQIAPRTNVDYAAFHERVHPDDQPLRDAAIKRAIETKGSCEIEYRILLPDGTVRWISGRAHCLSDGHGRSTRLLGVSMDVTTRKQAELEAQRLEDEIAHVGRVSMMGQLASALAHEINQPLGAILRNAEAAELFMQSKTPDLEEIRAILADIRTDDQRAGSVIDRMRALLKRHVLDTQLLDLAELVGTVTQLAWSDAAMRQVKLKVNLPADLPPVRGDRVHLQQVLLNLILNGMDAMNGASQENRRVTVSARVDAARTVEIAVSDTGHGISAEKLAQIFDPFFTTKPDGMGMGLAISRTIIESHGGRLWAESNNSSGATFRFTLPVAEETRETRDEGRGRE